MIWNIILTIVIIYHSVKIYKASPGDKHINRINGWLDTNFKRIDYKENYEEIRKTIIEKSKKLDEEQYEAIAKNIDKLNFGKSLPFYNKISKKYSMYL